MPAEMGMTFDIQIEADGWPSETMLEPVVARVLDALMIELPQSGGELSLLLTDDASVRALNARWRGVDKATNVLSFPQELPGSSLLGDVVLALETLRDEARDGGVPFEHHLSHLLLHGILHLLGYDHEEERDADTMEALEIAILRRLGIGNPYKRPSGSDQAA